MTSRSSSGSSMTESAGSNSSSSSSSVAATTQQADTITRNWLLGLPASGPAPGSAEEADLRAAEAFVSDVYAEIAAYDMANAQAMAAYAQRVSRYLPWRWGRRQAARGSTNEHDNDDTKTTTTRTAPAAAAAAAAASADSPLNTQTHTTRRGNVVQRSNLRDATATDAAADATLYNTWLFKRRHPGWVPLMQRWWVPWLCVAALVLVWTPDVWKLRTLYACDYYYAQLRQCVHKAYWRATMSTDDYNTLIAELEAAKPRSVKASDCPF